MFNKKRIIVFLIFILLMFFMMMFGGSPTENASVALRHVIFTDGYDGRNISEQDVEVGKDAKVPEDPYHRNFVFGGWFLYSDHDVRVTKFTNILNDLHVIALYKADRNNNGIPDDEDTYFTVSFINSLNNDVIKRERVLIGMDASAPSAPNMDGYTFRGWDRGYTNITDNINVYTIYNRITNNDEEEPKVNTYTVTFVDGLTNENISVQTVNEGASATLPNQPVHEKYVFVGWDGNYTNVRKNETVTAKFKVDENGPTGEPDNIPDDEQTYTITVHYLYDEDHDKVAHEKFYEERTYNNRNYNVTSPTDITPEKNVGHFTANPNKVTGTIADDHYLDKVEYVYYVRDTYTVTFNDYDGTELKTQEVAFEGDATAPADPTREATPEYTYTFSGWSADFTNVQGDLTVTAQYNETANPYTVELSKDNNVATVTGDGTYNYGASVTIKATLGSDEGYTYTFVNWTDEEGNEVSKNAEYTFSMPAKNVSYKANATKVADEVSYVVEYKQKDLNAETYTTKETLDKTGETDSQVDLGENYQTKYTGFTFEKVEYYNDETLTDSNLIAGNGKTKAIVYYTRNEVTVTIDPDCEGESCDPVGPTPHEYGDTITLKRLDRTYTLTYSENSLVTDKVTPNTKTVSAVFLGYCTEDTDDCELITIPEEGKVVDVIENVTYYARWDESPLTFATEVGNGYTEEPYDYAFKDWTDGTATYKDGANITLSGSTTLTAEYTPSGHEYTVTLDKDANVASVTGAGTYKYGDSVTITATLGSEDGYTFTFVNWTDEEGNEVSKNASYTFTMPGNNVTYKANATKTANTDTVYEIHFFQSDIKENEDDEVTYTEITNDKLERQYTTDQTVTLTTEEFGGKYTGFTLNTTKSTMSGKVTYDPRLVLNLYYDRNTVTVTIDPDCEGESCDPVGPTPHEYGDTITLQRLDRTYTLTYSENSLVTDKVTPNTKTVSAVFLGYCTEDTDDCELITIPEEGKVVDVIENVTYYARWDESPLTFATEVGNGYTEEPYDYAFKDWTDGTATYKDGANITLSGSTTLTAEYTPSGHEYTVTLDKDANVASVTGAGTYKYGDSVTITATLGSEDGYTFTFVNWTDEEGNEVSKNASYTFTMPGNNVTYKANATKTANTNTPYVIEYYKKDVKAETYSSAGSDNKTGTTNQPVDLGNYENKFEGFNYEKIEYYNDTELTTSNLINGNGKTVVKIYYTRESYTLSVTAGDNVSSVTGAGTYEYGESVTITATLGSETGYTFTFTNWTDDNNSDSEVSKNASYTFTMPAEDTAYTAHASKTGNNVTYCVEFYYENNGSYGDPIGDERTGQAGTAVSFTTQELTPQVEGYVLDEENENNNFSDVIAGDGTTVLKAYFKQTFKVTYAPGDKGTFTSVEHSGLYYNDPTPSAPTEAQLTHQDGYHFTGWNPTPSSTVTSDATYTAQWAADENIEYTIEIYKEKSTGGYDTTPSSTETKNDGVMGARKEITPETISGYVFDSENQNNVTVIESLAYSGNVFKLYYKRTNADISSSFVRKVYRMIDGVKTDITDSGVLEYGDIISYELKLNNTGNSDGSVVIADPGLVASSDKVTYSNTDPNKTIIEALLASEDGIEITVPAMTEKTITFELTVVGKQGDSITLNPYVGGEEKANVTTKIETTIAITSKSTLGANIVLTLDVSDSMNDGSPSRISSLRTAANEFIDTVANGKVNVCIVTFPSSENPDYDTYGSHSYAVFDGNGADVKGCSTDKETLKNIISNNLTTYKHGTPYTEALQVSASRLNAFKSNASTKNNPNYVVFLSDGQANSYADIAYEGYSVVAKHIRDCSAKIYTIGFDTQNIEGAEDVLRGIAGSTGKFYRASGTNISEVFASIASGIDTENKVTESGLLNIGSNIDTTQPIEFKVTNSNLNPTERTFNLTLAQALADDVVRDKGDHYEINAAHETRFYAGDHIEVTYYALTAPTNQGLTCTISQNYQMIDFKNCPTEPIYKDDPEYTNGYQLQVYNVNTGADISNYSVSWDIRDFDQTSRNRIANISRGLVTKRASYYWTEYWGESVVTATYQGTYKATCVVTFLNENRPASKKALQVELEPTEELLDESLLEELPDELNPLDENLEGEVINNNNEEVITPNNEENTPVVNNDENTNEVINNDENQVVTPETPVEEPTEVNNEPEKPENNETVETTHEEVVEEKPEEKQDETEEVKVETPAAKEEEVKVELPKEVVPVQTEEVKKEVPKKEEPKKEEVKKEEVAPEVASPLETETEE